MLVTANRASRLGLVTALLVALASPFSSFADDNVSVQKGVLKRGAGDYTAIAITAQNVLRHGVSRDETIKTLDRISEVGGNAVCVDLVGMDPSGKSIDKQAAEALKELGATVKDRYMTVICRLFGPNAPTGRGYRVAAAKTAATTFQDVRQIVFLIDGPSAEAAAKAFKKTAPNVIVAAPDGGDVAVYTDPASPPKTKPAVLFGALPPTLGDQVHFILPEGDSSYTRLDEASVTPSERQPWTPDNSVLSAEERAAGWIALFDGKSLNGWTVLGTNPNAWKAHDNMLERVDKGSRGLRSHDKYDNFILRFDWSLPQGGNNGVHLRSPRGGRESKVGIEFQMLGDFGQPVSKTCTGSIYDVVAPTANAVKPNGQWNTTEITMDHSHVVFILNGQKVIDVDMDKNDDLKLRIKNGFIVLTEHSASVQYRNIRLKKL